MWYPRRRRRRRSQRRGAPRSPRSASSRRCRATCPRWVSASRTRSTWPSSRPTRRSHPGLDPGARRAEDDEAKPDVGKNAATKLAGDDEVIGVVGTLNSSVSQSVQPVLASANITQVSPANTGPALTQGPDLANPKRHVPDLLPHLHHRRHPGPVRRAVPVLGGGHQEGRDHPRQEGLRPGPGRRVHRGVQDAAVARSSRPRPSTPTRRTSPRSSARSRRPTRRPSTTAVSTRRRVR